MPSTFYQQTVEQLEVTQEIAQKGTKVMNRKRRLIHVASSASFSPEKTLYPGKIKMDLSKRNTLFCYYPTISHQMMEHTGN